jgi:phosphopantothenate-cysteine ligase
MNILITAGGTTEHIADVRAITNTGTGRLGSMVADLLAQSARVDRIFYVCNRGAIRPTDNEKTSVTFIGDVLTLEKAVKDILTASSIDAVVHSMAVSDYRVRTVSTADEISAAAAKLTGTQRSSAASVIAEAIRKSIVDAPNIRSGGKISSYHDDLVIVMEKTPKIISMFRKLAPEALLIGFKLLADVSKTELVQTALKLLQKNDLDYVLANDYKYLQEGRHIGHLVDSSGAFVTYESKEAIATAIASAVTDDNRRFSSLG